MSDVFGRFYADAYDDIYTEKDYDGETELLVRLFREYADGAVGTVLDLGCGTGGHALRLAARGYEVVGVDRSEEMLEQAQAKAEGLSGEVSFSLGDIRAVRLNRQFDAVLVLFAVLGYQTGNADVLAALQAARAHLRPGGLLLFDVWYGPAVLRNRPTQRFKSIDTERGRLLRLSKGELDVRHHLCEVDIHLWLLAGDRLVTETEERHSVRFFFPLELELVLGTAGFSLERLGAFPEFDRDPDESTWNVLAVARLVE
jgi:SAM-dependent methyltransferase